MCAKTEILLPQPVAYILSRLTSAGHEAYIVGGCVRDVLLGKAPHDWDICTNALPDETAALFAGHTVVPTGLAHGTVTLVLENEPYEITTFRKESEYSDGRRPDKVEFVTSITTDLSRRDFTANAIAYHPAVGFIDPFGGKQDIAKGLLRCVGDARRRFSEDYLRILRALRFAATYGFSIHPDTAAAVHQEAVLLKGVAAERILAELRRLLCGQNAADILNRFSDVFFVLLPQLAPMQGCTQPCVWHDKDVWQHTICAVGLCPPDEVCRFTMLFHDAGKPFVRTVDEQQTAHFYGHAQKSEALARESFCRLKADNRLKVSVCRLVSYHDAVPSATEKSVRRWLARLGEEDFLRLLAVWRADVGAQSSHERSARLANLDEMVLIFEKIKERNDCFTLKQLAVNGSDLIKAGACAGPKIGVLLKSLLEEVVEGRLPNDRETLLCAAKMQIFAQDET